MFSVILYVVACALLVIAAFGRGRWWPDLAWLGMALWLFTWQILPHL